MEILSLRPHDRDQWETLWSLYFEYFGRASSENVQSATWEKLHNEAVPVHGLAAFTDRRMIGFLLYNIQPATRSIGPHCYISDLFIHEAARGKGVGRALVLATFDHARKFGCDRVYWLTQENNAAARRLYDQIAENSGLVEYRHNIS